MGNAAVVSDENDVFERSCQIGERQIFCEADSRIRPNFFELPGLRLIRFAGDDHESRAKLFQEIISELDPVLQRPVLLCASAAGMKRNQRGGKSGKKCLGTMSIL